MEGQNDMIKHRVRREKKESYTGLVHGLLLMSSASVLDIFGVRSPDGVPVHSDLGAFFFFSDETHEFKSIP